MLALREDFSSDEERVVIAQGDALLLMGAILVATATFLFARSGLRGWRGGSQDADPVGRRGVGEVAISLVGLGLGLVVVAIGFVVASSGDGFNPVVLFVAAFTVGAAATLPGGLIMMRGWRRFVQWTDHRSSSNPPLVWLVGAALSIVGFTTFAVFLPVVYLVIAT